jgi:ATP-dependent DNA helicase RecQ
MQNLNEELKKYFHFDNFRPGQKEVIEIINQNRSALAVFPTGQGKSLCYQLSAVLKPGTALVVSPLLALMKDQVDFLNNLNIPARRLDSSLNYHEYKKTVEELQNGLIKLLYVAPERFSNERFVNLISELDTSFMVIDEAHCISEWGHNFRPDYLKLAGYANKVGIEQFLTLTATATPKVVSDIQSCFSINAEDYIHTGFYRPNLKLLFSPCPEDERLDTLLIRLKERSVGPCIVYATRQKTTEEISAYLNQYGFKAKHYHAGMEDQEREQVQDWFMQEESSIVCATIAFGMGIDKSDIRYVYHYNLPKSLENYSQEIGRAGRDGDNSICEVIGGKDDLRVLENFVYGDTPDYNNLENAIRDILLSEQDNFGISIHKLAYAHDIKPLVLSTLLTYIEVEGLLSSTGSYFSEYKFKALKPSTEIFSRVKGERAAFLRRLFRLAIQKDELFKIDLNHAIKSLNEPRQRVISTLSWLEESGFIELSHSGLQQGYRVEKRVSESELRSIIQTMMDRFQQRENGDINRLHLILDLIHSDECQVNKLIEYFGEKRKKPCGHCGVCTDENEIEIDSIEENHIGEDEAQLIFSVANSTNYQMLNNPRALTHFLCGVSSPTISSKRLSRHSNYGALKEYSFNDVLQWIETNNVIPG